MYVNLDFKLVKELKLMLDTDKIKENMYKDYYWDKFKDETS